jgi:ribonuclease G
MPEADHVGVSRKIEDAIERERLRRIAEASRPPGFGIIIRTEAEGVTEADLKQDVSFVLELWGEIKERRDAVRAPGVVYQDLSLLYRTLRDVFGADVRSILIDSPEEHKKAVEFVEKVSPRFKNRVLLYDDSEPILMKHGVEAEAERLLRRKVWLKGGGYLTIDETEALTSIDVNTGKFIGSSSLSETILQVNLDAAEEAARQLRLRDIGGIVIVDFIDMTSERDRETLLKHFESSLALDRMRVKMSHISPLGLVELTRKRTAESINEVISQACPYCHGRGKIASTETVSIQIERELKQLAAHSDAEAFLVAANLEVALFLVGPEGRNVARLEAECGRKIFVRGDERNHVEEYGIIPGAYEELSLQLNRFGTESLVECLVDADSLIEPPRSSGWADGLCVELLNGAQYAGQRVHAKLNSVDRSYATGEVVGVGPPP